MKDLNDIIKKGRETLANEASAVQNLRDRIGKDFAQAVHTIMQSEGRVVLTGIGKSANVGRKIVATLNSTGTPSLFMHAADAIHGDLGNVQKGDTVLCISNSGNTPEIKVLVPLVKSMGNTLIGMTGAPGSYLSEQADLVIDSGVEQEACPIDLAPTSSTTAQMVLGDALAVALMDRRGFSREDFARFHPGGSLGKKLYLRMGDLVDPDIRPAVKPDAPMKEVIYEISSKRMGVTAVLEDEEIIGVVTDGDLRRMLEKYDSPNTLRARDIMTTSPKIMDEHDLAVDGFHLMESQNITQVFVKRDGTYIGAVHLHDILKEGVF